MSCTHDTCLRGVVAGTRRDCGPRVNAANSNARSGHRGARTLAQPDPHGPRDAVAR
jgi:hypothetical protein